MINYNIFNIFCFSTFSFGYFTNPVFWPNLEKIALKTRSRKYQKEKVESWRWNQILTPSGRKFKIGVWLLLAGQTYSFSQPAGQLTGRPVKTSNPRCFMNLCKCSMWILQAVTVEMMGITACVTQGKNAKGANAFPAVSYIA